MTRPSLFLLAIVAALAGCGRRATKASSDGGAAKPASTDHPPVAINPVSPVEYPAALLAQQVEGRVLLRLHVDTAGAILPDSTRVAESSGYPALDSAAVAGAGALRFAPALHHGRPVALSFIQPVLFRFPRARGATP